MSSASALISALNLLFGRLDARRARANAASALPLLDLADALGKLRFLLSSWLVDTSGTQYAIDEWLSDHNDDNLRRSLIPALRDAYAKNMLDARQVQGILESVPRSGGPVTVDADAPWRSLIELLRVYGPEVADVVYNVYSARHAALTQLAELVLAEDDQEKVQEIAEELRRTSKGLSKAVNMTAKYLRANFAINYGLVGPHGALLPPDQKDDDSLGPEMASRVYVSGLQPKRNCGRRTTSSGRNCL